MLSCVRPVVEHVATPAPAAEQPAPTLSSVVGLASVTVRVPAPGAMVTAFASPGPATKRSVPPDASTVAPRAGAASRAKATMSRAQRRQGGA